MTEEITTEKTVIVVEGGMVTEVYSPNSNAVIVVIDIDNKRIGENSITEFTWPETQFDDSRVKELLKDY